MAADHDDPSSARRRRIAGSALVAVLAAVLVAIVVVRSGGEKVLNENGDTLVLVGQSTEDSDGVGLDAVLAVVGGCLGVRGGTIASSTVVVWPHGTTVETPEPLRIRVDGSVYGIGDTIEIGDSQIGALERDSYFYDKVPSSCRSAQVFVANNG